MKDRMDLDVLPTCLDYAALLDKICKKEKINRDDARTKYGRKTYKEWNQILQS